MLALLRCRGCHLFICFFVSHELPHVCVFLCALLFSVLLFPIALYYLDHFSNLVKDNIWFK